MRRHDEIVDEIRAARKAYAAQFDFDLANMVKDLKLKEAAHQGDFANLRPIARKRQTR